MAASKIFIATSIIAMIFFCPDSWAQSRTPLLERNVSVRASNKSTDDVLKLIEQQGGFTFSYSPQVVEGIKPVTIQESAGSVREMLDKIFSGTVTYKEKVNHIILIRKTSGAVEQESSYFIISGYINDGSNGNKIPEVSVFDKNSRESAVSDQYGYFKIKISDKVKNDVLFLSVNKIDYRDTVYVIRERGNKIVNVTIYPVQNVSLIDSTAIRDSILNADQIAFLNMILSDELKTNTRNINDTLYSKFQLSFLPFLGTNLRLSGNTVNDYSLNVLAGYSMGTRKAEVGGLFNIDRDSVKSVQVAGLSNFAGGHVSGAQVAGLFNLNMKSNKGVQVAGLFNNNIDTSHATQIAGLMNVNLRRADAPQIAGLTNINVGDVNGVQISGLLNVAVKDMKGLQLSGLVNYARTVHGTQIGFLNVSDSCTGVPVGFLSLVKSGYHQFEVSADETFPLNASFRTGVKPFYNILTAGIKSLKPEENIWYFGYGVGSAIRIGKKWDLNLEVTVNQPLKNNNLYYFNPLSRFNLLVEKRFSKYFSIAAGPVVNLFYANTRDPDFADVLSQLPPAKVLDSSFQGDYYQTSWVGGKISVRFF